MSLLSGLTKLNPISLASTLAESACDALLPKELEFIGDLASLAVNLKTGNFAKAIDDLQDLQADLSQQLATLAKKYRESGAAPGVSADLPGTCPTEPSPPPPYCDHALNRGSWSRAGESAGNRAAPDFVRFAPPRAGLPPPPPSNNPVVSGSVARGRPRTPTGEPAITRPAGGPAGERKASQIKSDSPATTSKADKPDKPSKADKAGAATGSKGEANAFFAKSDKELMAALRSGSLPEAVKTDPAQMQRLQMRINDYAQMNQLITTMLTALHEMNKQVIQNLRV